MGDQGRERLARAITTFDDAVRVNAARTAERSRLEAEVVKTAKAIRLAAKSSYVMPTAAYRATVDEFNSAVDALVEFESQES